MIICLFLLCVCVCRLLSQIKPQNVHICQNVLFRSQLGAKCRWRVILKVEKEGECESFLFTLLQPHLQK